MYELLIEGKTITATGTQNYNCLCRAINIIEWLKLNSNNFGEAALFFDCHEGALRRRVHKLGYKPDGRPIMSVAMVEKAMIEHMETGFIKKTMEETGFTRTRFNTRMRRMGYSFKDRRRIVKEVSKVGWSDILYNKVLSCRELV